jgi:hypothetical protein
MSGSTSFGKKGNASIDPTAVADVSPVSESDDIYIPGKPDTSADQQKKMKKNKKATETKAQGNTEEKAKNESDAAGSQASPCHLALERSRTETGALH